MNGIYALIIGANRGYSRLVTAAANLPWPVA